MPKHLLQQCCMVAQHLADGNGRAQGPPAKLPLVRGAHRGSRRVRRGGRTVDTARQAISAPAFYGRPAPLPPPRWVPGLANPPPPPAPPPEAYPHLGGSVMNCRLCGVFIVFLCVPITPPPPGAAGQRPKRSEAKAAKQRQIKQRRAKRNNEKRSEATKQTQSKATRSRAKQREANNAE